MAASLAVLIAVVFTSLPGLIGRGNGKAGMPVKQSAIRAAPGAGNARENVDRIVAAHLFGKADEKKAELTRKAPETKLRLRLMGMIASADQRYARALIEVNSRQVDSYKPGDSVKGTDAKLGSVETNRVLLDRHGAMESLYLRLPVVPLHGDRAGAARGNAVSSNVK
ncbi:MAG: type II secretion system protein N [Arenicellales bacterium]